MVGCSRREQRRELRLGGVQRVAEALPAVASLHEDHQFTIVRDSAEAFEIRELDLRLEVVQVRAVVFDSETHRINVR